MTRLAPLLVAICLAMSACQKTSPPSSFAGTSSSGTIDADPVTLALGDMAGDAQPVGAPGIPNPYSHDPKAIAEGMTLFLAMNCAGCHAYGGGGAMGPDLTDAYWRYGGAPAQIFNSISRGRPQGMPAWGKALPAAEVWKIVAYVESISKTGAAQAPESSAAASQAGATEGTGLGRADRK